MKILIAYYTRTNTTKKVAEVLANKLQADSEQIIDTKDRQGARGYLGAGRDAMAKKLTKIEPPKFNPAEYDLVLLGTPVWVGLMAPAIREYIRQNKEALKKVAYFSTQGSARPQRVFGEMAEYTGIEPLAAEYFKTKDVIQDSYLEKLEKFCEIINNYEG